MKVLNKFILTLVSLNSLLLIKGQPSTIASSSASSISFSSSESSSSSSLSKDLNKGYGYECINPGGKCDMFTRYCSLGYACFDIKYDNETDSYEGICKKALGYFEICNGEECELGLKCGSINDDEDDDEDDDDYVGDDDYDSQSQEKEYRCIDMEYAGFGEPCERTSQCLGTLKCLNSICSQDLNSTTCEEIHNCPSQHYCSGGECDFGIDCPLDYLQCKPLKEAGGSCIYGYECDYNSTCINGVCIKKNSLKEGEDCSNNYGYPDACESLHAVYENYTLKCANENSSQLNNCLVNDCPLSSSYYFCNAKTNKCEPYISTSQECQQAKLERDYCYINNGCILLNSEPRNFAHYNSKSCYMKNCRKETINFLNQCETIFKICN